MLFMSEFKKCTFCNKTWETKESFLKDHNIMLIGYTADFKDIDFGLFYYTHRDANCNTTLGIYAKLFKSLYDGPIYDKIKTGNKDCTKKCLNKYDLEKCPTKCKYAYMREIADIIHHIDLNKKKINNT